MNTPAEHAIALSSRKLADFHESRHNHLLLTGGEMQASIDESIVDQVAVIRGELPLRGIEDWRSLEQSGLLTPFQRHEWLVQWQRQCAAADHEDAVTALCYHNGQPVLILPLSLWRRWGVTCLSWQAHRVNDYCGPILHPSILGLLDESRVTRLLRQVADQVGGVDLYYLPKQLPSVAGQANPFVLAQSERYHAGIHAVSLGNDWESYYKAQRSAKSRRRLKEKFAALHRLGEVKFHIADTGTEKSKIVATCLDLKSQQLAKLGHWDPFLDADLRQLFSAYAETEQNDRFWAVALTVNGEPAAVAFGYSDQKQWLLYQMAMASGPAAQYSPGTLLLHKLMQHCIGQNVSRLDLSLGDESYKLEWCNEHGSLTTSFLPLSLAGTSCLMVLKARAMAHRLIISHPAAYELGKRIKAGLAKWQRRRDTSSSQRPSRV